jgi:hypothetical protein
MRSLLPALLGYVLALLLLGTSPVGTGQGVHQNQLLDALVPHVHLPAAAQVVNQPTASPAASETYGHAPAFGAGAGAATSASGLALVPVLPTRALALTTFSERRVVAIGDDALPPEQTEAPPDPPPNSTRPAHV